MSNATPQTEEFIPGVMRCAKCNFVLHRVTLHAFSGGVSSGDNRTEPCPNGCGPLWPMTWRQQAGELQERCEEQLARAVAFEKALQTISDGNGETLPLRDAAGGIVDALPRRLTTDDLRDIARAALLRDSAPPSPAPGAKEK